MLPAGYFLKPHAVELKVAHPEMLKTITAAKKKNDWDGAKRICDRSKQEVNRKDQACR